MKARAALALAAVLTLVVGAEAARAEAGAQSSAKFSCSGVTYTFTGFPSANNNTVREVVYVDGAAVAGRTFSFNGPSGSNTVEVGVPPGHHNMDARARWDTNGVKGGRDEPKFGGITCPPPEFTIQKLQEIAGSGAGFTTAPLTGEVGQTIKYEIVLKNTGGIGLKFTDFTDPHCDKGTIAGGPGEAVVAPNEETVYTCVHVLTFADLIARSYTNSATDTGIPQCAGCAPITKTSNIVVVTVTGKYAAVGDSFTSGEGVARRFVLKNYYAFTNEPEEEAFKENEKFYEGLPTTNQCHRSRLAYPGVVARTLYGAQVTTQEEVAKQQPPKFIFRACSGAVTKNLIPPGPGQYNEPATPIPLIVKPPQLDWLTLPGGLPAGLPNGAIRLVTVGIGGNDAGFATILKACLESNSEVVNKKEGWSPEHCKAVIKEWVTGTGEAAGKGIPSIKKSLRNVLSTIRTDAPNAAIRVVLYPKILDLRHLGNVPVGRVSICLIGETTFFVDKVVGANIAGALTVFEEELNRTIRETTEKWAAAESQENVKTVRTWEALAGHEIGDFPIGSGELWVNDLLFLPKSEEGLCPFPKPSAESFHPNARGHAATAKEVLKSLL